MCSVTACLKVDDLNVPHQQEGYQGAYDIVPFVKDFVGASTANLVNVKTDGTGKVAHIYGIPSNTSFPIIPSVVIDNLTEAGLSFPYKAVEVSGLVTEVVSKSEMRIVDFKQKTPSVDALGIKVRGTLIKDEKLLYTKDKAPIVIYIEKAKTLKDILTPLGSRMIEHATEDTTLADLADDAEVPLYLMEFEGEALTVL